MHDLPTISALIKAENIGSYWKYFFFLMSVLTLCVLINIFVVQSYSDSLKCKQIQETVFQFHWCGL